MTGVSIQPLTALRGCHRPVRGRGTPPVCRGLYHKYTGEQPHGDPAGPHQESTRHQTPAAGRPHDQPLQLRTCSPSLANGLLAEPLGEIGSHTCLDVVRTVPKKGPLAMSTSSTYQTHSHSSGAGPSLITPPLQSHWQPLSPQWPASPLPHRRHRSSAGRTSSLFRCARRPSSRTSSPWGRIAKSTG